MFKDARARDPDRLLLMSGFAGELWPCQTSHRTRTTEELDLVHTNTHVDTSLQERKSDCILNF